MRHDISVFISWIWSIHQMYFKAKYISMQTLDSVFDKKICILRIWNNQIPPIVIFDLSYGDIIVLYFCWAYHCWHKLCVWSAWPDYMTECHWELVCCQVLERRVSYAWCHARNYKRDLWWQVVPGMRINRFPQTSISMIPILEITKLDECPSIIKIVKTISTWTESSEVPCLRHENKVKVNKVS